MVVDTPHKAY